MKRRGGGEEPGFSSMRAELSCGELNRRERERERVKNETFFFSAACCFIEREIALLLLIFVFMNFRERKREGKIEWERRISPHAPLRSVWCTCSWTEGGCEILVTIFLQI